MTFLVLASLRRSHPSDNGARAALTISSIYVRFRTWLYGEDVCHASARINSTKHNRNISTQSYTEPLPVDAVDGLNIGPGVQHLGA